MSLLSYKDALKMGKEAIDKMLVPAKVRRAKKQAELEMCKLDEDLAKKTAKLQEACTREDVDFSAIINVLDDIAILERRRNQYTQILEEMFPDDEKEDC